MLKRRFSSIRVQMVLVSVIGSLLIAILIATACISIIYNTMEQQAAATLMDVTGQINGEAQIMLDEGQRLLRWSDVQAVSDFLYGTGERRLESIAMVSAFQWLTDSKMIGASVNNIFLLDTDGYGFNQRTGLMRIEENARAREIDTAIRGGVPDMLYFDNNDGSSSLVLHTPILQVATHIVIGYMAVELRTDTIEHILRKATADRIGTYFITDADGHVLFSADPDSERIACEVLDSADPEIHHIIGSEMVVRTQLTATDWYAIGYSPTHELMSGFYDILAWLLLIILAVLTGAVILYIFISKRLTAPIQRLKGCMLQAADGHLDAIVSPISSLNEFSVLEKQYNRMLTDIQSLMQRSHEEQIKLRKAELRALQAQINPHFLYNTLDAVIWLVAAEKNNAAIEMIEQLSVFFRIGLSKGMDWISVREDIEHLSSYLYIQRVRYSDRLDFTIKVDQGIMECIMLKMTLQPIVENAIYHGIKRKKEGGHITVTGSMEESGCLVFTIRDTGMGMTKEECTQVQTRLAKGGGLDEQPGGFGLYNVDRRIKLYCGDAYGLTVESEQGTGTIVTVRIRPGEVGGAYV